MANSSRFSRSNHKRSCQELEDSDECLPISKRINSLHIEGQSNLVIPQLLDRRGANEFDGFSKNGAGSGSPSLREASIQQNFPQSHNLEYANGRNIHDVHDMNSVGSVNNHGQSFPAPLGDSVFGHQHPSTSSQSHTHESFLNNNGSHQLSHHQVGAGEIQHLAYNGYTPSKASLNGANSPALQGNDSPFHALNSTQNPFFPSVSTGLQNSFQNVQNNDGNQSLSFHNQSPDLDFHLQQLPSGNYDPELDLTKNPYYFSINQMLYEAHVSRVRRDNRFSEDS
uniref:Uncharacterized protein n=1 Tax=Biomphalaria glabrata TaxID=6526 RepID=A0A2C9LLD4_BIOGL